MTNPINEQKSEQGFNAMVRARVHGSGAIALFGSKSSLQDRSIKMFGIAFTSMDEAAKKLFIYDLLQNEYPAQYNLLKKQLNLSVQNITEISTALDNQVRMKSVVPNTDISPENTALSIIKDLISVSFKPSSR